MEDRYIRVATTQYKIVRKPLLSGDFMELRVPWNYETLRQDETKDFISQISTDALIFQSNSVGCSLIF